MSDPSPSEPNFDEPQHGDDPEPLYRYSWKRFVVVATALLTLPAWGPWVKHNVGLRQLLLVVPFVVIFSFSIWCLSFMLPSRAIRQRNKRE